MPPSTLKQGRTHSSCNDCKLMKLIVITRPDFYAGESEQIRALIENGLEYLHLRKPNATPAEMEMLLNQLPTACLGRIVLHDCFELTSRYPLRGIHLSSRHSEPPTGFCGGLSCSCHTLQEISERKQHFHYLFLSPIFDSISKKGYSSAFPTNVLEEAHRRHIIDQRVVALGGITLDKIATVRKLGFGGVALLGDIWQQAPEQFLPHFQALRREVLR